MKLSETSRAKEWLEQFEDDDRSGAIALLDAIRFVPGGTVITEVRTLLEKLVEEGELEQPVALTPILSIEDMVRSNDSTETAPVAFVDFDPAQPIAHNPGSEALFAQLITELHRSTRTEWLVHGSLTVDDLRDSKVRTLVCLTDYIGSGRQVIEYVDSWYRNPTIKSWCSFGWLKIVVIAYAATTLGMQAVGASDHLRQIHVVEVVHGERELQQTIPVGKVIEVCKIYAKRGKVKPALGYRRSAGLFATSFSIPNNLPAILIKTSRYWVPFFDGRSVSGELASEIGEQQPQVDTIRHLEEAGQLRLARRQRDGQLDGRWRDHVRVLALLPCSDGNLALALGRDLNTIGLLRKALKELCLVSADNRVTKMGRATLTVHRRGSRRGSISLTPNTSPYYPRYMK